MCEAGDMRRGRALQGNQKLDVPGISVKMSNRIQPSTKDAAAACIGFGGERGGCKRKPREITHLSERSECEAERGVAQRRCARNAVE